MLASTTEHRMRLTMTLAHSVRFAAACAAVGVLGPSTAAVAAVPGGTAAAASAACSTAPSSWTAGSVDLCRGTLVYSDYVHDDYGADTGAVMSTGRTAGLSPTAGDQTY